MTFKMSKEEKAASKKHQEAVVAAAEFLRGVVDRVQGEFDEKSETWQDGDKGTAVSDWIELMTNAADELEGQGDALEELVEPEE